MKRTFFYGMLLMLNFTLMSSMCSSDDDGMNPNNTNVDISEITNNMQSGTWRITSYVDSGQDETNDFAGYSFTFNSDGTLVATNTTTTYNGTWSVSNSSNSSSSSSDDDVDFNIFFPVPDTNDFEDLNDDWDVVNYTDTTLSLIDISGGNGGTDTLVFQMN